MSHNYSVGQYKGEWAIFDPTTKFGFSSLEEEGELLSLVAEN